MRLSGQQQSLGPGQGYRAFSEVEGLNLMMRILDILVGIIRCGGH